MVQAIYRVKTSGALDRASGGITGREKTSAGILTKPECIAIAAGADTGKGRPHNYSSAKTPLRL